MAHQKVDQNLNLDESAENLADSSTQLEESKNKISSRISYLRSRLGLSLSPQVATSAIQDYSKIAERNPGLSHFRILAKMPQNRREALTQITSAVPLPTLVGATDSQFQRVVRDVISEQNKLINEEFAPPAVLLLKRQAIRQFPNGQRVALYVDNKLNLTFTVPYDATGRGLSAGRVIPAMMSEEAESTDVSDLPFEPNATRPEMPPGKQPASFRHVRNLARRAMKAGIAAQETQTTSHEDLVAQHMNLHAAEAKGELPAPETNEEFSIVFGTGEQLTVPIELAEKIDRVYNNLNEENQALMYDMILESSEQFYRVVEFVESIEQQ